MVRGLMINKEGFAFRDRISIPIQPVQDHGWRPQVFYIVS